MSNDYTRKAIVEFLDGSPSVEGKTVLDYGCGDGWGTLELQRRGAIVMAYDVDTKAGLLLKGADVLLGSLGNILNKEFDIIFCHHVLEHVYEPLAFLKNMLLLMHNDSELWLSTPNFAANHAYCKGHIMPYTMPVLIEHLRYARFDTANGSYLTTHPDFGHLRVRVKESLGLGVALSAYPEPMKGIMQRDQRVDNKHLMSVNW